MISTRRGVRGRLGPLVAVVVAAVMPCACGSDEQAPPRRVIAYVSADPQTAMPILEAFERETGIHVDPLFDTEATKTTGLAERVRRESSRPRADVFWSSEPFAVEQLASEGLLAPIGSPTLSTHPAAWRRQDDRWFAFAGRGRVIAYRPDRLDPDEGPRTWMDLADPRWGDQIAMADPRFGTTRGHVGAIAAGWGDDRFLAWLDGLAANRVRLLPGGNAATVDAVARGEVLLGLTDTDDVRAAQARGVEIAAVLPRHVDDERPGGGTLVVPNAAGVVTGASHPDEGLALVAFLASPTVERMLQASPAGHQPVAHRAVAFEPGFDVLHETDPWTCVIEEVAAVMNEAVAHAMERLVDHPVSADPAS